MQACCYFDINVAIINQREMFCVSFYVHVTPFDEGSCVSQTSNSSNNSRSDFAFSIMTCQPHVHRRNHRDVAYVITNSETVSEQAVATRRPLHIILSRVRTKQKHHCLAKI